MLKVIGIIVVDILIWGLGFWLGLRRGKENYRIEIYIPDDTLPEDVREVLEAQLRDWGLSKIIEEDED